MKLNETRESAHLRSRVTDLSVVPNLVSYNALLACITPLASQNVEHSEEDNEVYKPMLIRDVDTLIANFGDPRIDPEKYVDLYAIMRMVKNGGTCYLAKVNSGNTGVYEKEFNYDAKSALEKESITVEANNSQWRLNSESTGASTVWHTVSNKEDQKCHYTKDNPPYKMQVSKPGKTPEEPILTVFYIVKTEPTKDTVKYEIIDGTEGKFSYKFTFEEPQDLLEENTIITFTFEGAPVSKTVDDCRYVEDTSYDNIIKSANPVDGDFKLENHILARIEDKKDVTIPLDEIESVELNAEGNLIIRLRKAIRAEWKNVAFTATFYKQKDGANLPVVPTSIKVRALSALTEDIEITQSLDAVQPLRLNVAMLKTVVYKLDKVNNIRTELCSSRIKMSRTLTNQDIINALNTSLGTYVQFDLDSAHKQYADCAFSSINDRDNYSIVKLLNIKYKFFGKDATDQDIDMPLTPINNVLDPFTEDPNNKPSFNVKFDAYRKSLDQYKDRRYTGCIIADMSCIITRDDLSNKFGPMSKEDLRTLHYYIKGIAAERKDCTALLSTPQEITTISGASEFALSTGTDASLWEYGETPTTDYTLQSFYLEMYYPWLKIKCNKISNAGSSNEIVNVAPTAIVLDNILKSYRERGVHYPVAGDQYGQLSDIFSVVNNPKTKLDRDQLIKSRINPIWDTGKRGIQIYGNETLNAGYTDLNAAHIARTLVYIHNKIDEYTETLKFNINSVILWNRWKSYVSDYILEPLKSENAISDYEVMMGEDTTTREEIANRMLKGKIKLIFYQAAEVIDLDYVVYSSSNVTIADAEAQI